MERDITFDEAVQVVRELATPEKICAFSDEQKTEYIKRLEYFKLVNGGNYSDVEKGKSLEDLVS